MARIQYLKLQILKKGGCYIMDVNSRVLNEVHKGLVMGMESISVVSSKVEDQAFKQVLDEQYKQYGNILDRVNKELECSRTQGQDTSAPEKAMGWASIQLNNIMDKSNSHIADMLITGTTMGIIKGRKLLNQNSELKHEVKQALDDFVKEQEHQVEKLKEWL